MEYSHFCILLLLLSLALLVAEVFVPSGGFIAVLMLLSLAGSVFCGFRAWWETNPGLWWTYVASLVVLLPSVLIGAFTIFPRTPFGRRILLEAPEPDEIAPYAREQVELQQLVGKQGKTVTAHRPSGMLLVDGVRYHSETRGLMLDGGELVDIVAVRGNRLVVRLASGPLPEPEASSELTTETLEKRSEKLPEPDKKADSLPLDPFLGEVE